MQIHLTNDNGTIIDSWWIEDDCLGPQPAIGFMELLETKIGLYTDKEEYEQLREDMP